MCILYAYQKAVGLLLRQRQLGGIYTIYRKKRTEATHIIKKIITSEIKNKSKQKQDNKTLKEIKNKVNNNNLIITKADKSQATVIIDKTDYIRKTEDFINNNDCIQLNKDPTEKYLKQTIKLIKTTKNIFNNKDTDIYINNNTEPPKMNSLIKMHKLSCLLYTSRCV